MALNLNPYMQIGVGPQPEPPKELEHVLLAEPITAWRVWRIERVNAVALDKDTLADLSAKWQRGENPFEGLTGARLAAVAAGTTWAKQVTAVCNHGNMSAAGGLWMPLQLSGTQMGSPVSKVSHDAPERSCGCGIWAVKDDAMLARAYWNYGGHDLAYGRVQMWGRFYEHELGYRAEFARPIEIIVPDGQQAVLDELAAFYGCPARAGTAPAKPQVPEGMVAFPQGSTLYNFYFGGFSPVTPVPLARSVREATRLFPGKFPLLERATKNIRPARSTKVEWVSRNHKVGTRPAAFSNYTQITRTPFDTASMTASDALRKHLESIEQTLEHGVPSYDAVNALATCGGYRHYLGRDLRRRDKLTFRPLRDLAYRDCGNSTFEWLTEFSLQVEPA